MMRRVFATAAIVLCSLAIPSTAMARSVYGKFTELKSADHLVLDHGAGTYEVKIYGVQTPKAGEPFALEAKMMVQGMVAGKECRVRIMHRNAEDQMVAQILVDGQDVALALLRAGLAQRLPDVHYKPSSKYEPDDLVKAEIEGRQSLRGLWKAASADGKAFDFASLTPEIERGTVGNVDKNASQKSSNDNECAIAQDPTNPLRLFQSCNTSSAGMFAARSVDGGVTWTYPDPSDKTITDGDAGQGVSACCDPTLAWDKFGNLFITYISNSLNSIETMLSTDGGLTFTTIGQFSGSIDQPTVTVADVAGGSAVWVVWNQSNSIVARGALATGLGTVGAWSTLQTAPTTSSCNFGDIAISPAGKVIQVCENPSGGQGPNANLRINVDADGIGGSGFGATAVATTTNCGGFDFIPAQNARSVDAEAGLAYDSNPASPNFGRLYLMYTDELVDESHNLNIMIRYSDNDGATWSSPIQINDDATTRSQFLPKLAVDRVTSNIAVCWHDARNSGSNTGAEIYCSTASGADAVPTFAANTAISDGISVSNGSGVEFGDYMGLAFVDGVAHPVWADTSNSTGDNPNGTSAFDAYTDFLVVAVAGIFEDGFEVGNTSGWDASSP